MNPTMSAMSGLNVPYSNGVQVSNPAYVKWVASIPDFVGDADLLEWLKRNPAPPKNPPPVSQAVADYIAEEVKRQVALALANK
jgi:hypothetical protein